MLTETYNPQEIELILQQKWRENRTFEVTEDSNKKKFYCLSMFPYPSGYLHMGHVRNYAIGDVISRYQMMLGKNVMQPMGFDSFGLPAENAAIKNKTAPASWTYKNIDHMIGQFNRLGFAYDWSRKIATCTPDYYKWEQWLFVKMLEKGLVYRKDSVVNWDPIDQTVLANEQVIDGRGWRSGAIVERKKIPQWFLKITAYAEELLCDLDNLDGWPEQVKTMQKNWIGRSYGVEIKFGIKGREEKLEVYTTRADTLFGVTFMAVAAEHPILTEITDPKILAFIKECQKTKVAEAEIETMEKIGMDTGLKAIHPFTQAEIPIWVTNYVLMDYGSGAVMAVPAHDDRDYAFAKKYSIEIKQVIKPNDSTEINLENNALTEKGVLINSAQFNNLSSDESIDAIAKTLSQKNLGNKKTNYRLRDWGVSRQRYWGTPIPIIYCEKCGAVPVPEKDLPVILPENVEFTATGSPLREMPEFFETSCPKCNGKAKRETDTFDTFVESSWYYARYACPNLKEKILDERAKYWTPVDQYIGGIEHACMHLLYARFIHKILRDFGFVNSDEPFTRLLTQGMVLKDGSKMSKSLGNTVDPQELIDQFGADTVRVFSIFASPPEQSLEWSDSGVEGAYRFLKRIWAFAFDKQETIRKTNSEKNAVNKDQNDYRREIHAILAKANVDMEKLQLNTIVSACMKIFNILAKIPTENSADIHEGFGILLRLLGPIAPHITEHLWHELEYGDSIISAEWPTPDSSALKTDTINLVVQVNGKLRGNIEIAADAAKETIEEMAKNNANVQKIISTNTIKKIIIVPKRIVNIVI